MLAVAPPFGASRELVRSLLDVASEPECDVAPSVMQAAQRGCFPQ
jgi:hypothetical protein